MDRSFPSVESLGDPRSTGSLSEDEGIRKSLQVEDRVTLLLKMDLVSLVEPKPTLHSLLRNPRPVNRRVAPFLGTKYLRPSSPVNEEPTPFLDTKYLRPPALE